MKIFILLFAMLILFCGCVSTEEREETMKLVFRYEALQKELQEIKDKFDSGTLTSAEAKEASEEIGTLLADTKLEYDRLKEQGYSTKDILLMVGTVLGNFALAFFGINKYRNTSHPLTTKIT